LKTKNLNIRIVTDLIRDRTKWTILVQTDRQPMEGKEEEEKDNK